MIIPLIECPAGQFGSGCIKRCSEYCLIRDRCNHISGECKNGCLDGFVGTHCNNCKIYLLVMLIYNIGECLKVGIHGELSRSRTIVNYFFNQISLSKRLKCSWSFFSPNLMQFFAAIMNWEPDLYWYFNVNSFINFPF